MAEPRIKIEGLDKTLKNLGRLNVNLSSCVRTAAWKLGGKIMMQAKDAARKPNFTGTPSDDPEPGTPTGRLMSSITMNANFSEKTVGLKSPAKSEDAVGKPGGSKDRPSVVVGSNVEYAPYVELGTKKMSARPYLYPAFFMMENDFEKTLIEVAEKKAALKNFDQKLPTHDPGEHRG